MQLALSPCRTRAASPHTRAGGISCLVAAPGAAVVRWVGRAAVAGAAVGTLLGAAPALAEGEGAALFARNCAGCHAGGGNVVNGAKTLRQSDLERYSVDPDAMYQIVYGGQGKMPGYGEDCAPKGACTFGPRLADDEIREVTSYVLAQAQAGWPAP